MDKKTIMTISITLLVGYVLARTALGNQLLDIQPNYFSRG